MLFGLVAVLVTLVAALYVSKRIAYPQGQFQRALRVLGAISVGPRERIVLIEVGNDVLVLGVTNGQIRTLHTLPSSEWQACSPPDDQTATAPSGFQARLQQILERYKS